MLGIKLRLALFLGLIVGPAGILTFLSLRAALDQQSSSLADVRLRAPALRVALDRRVGELVASLADDPTAPRPDLPEIVFHFSLDSLGSFLLPSMLRPTLPERSSDFALALQQGERLEFGQALPGAAAEVYRVALDAALAPGEEAEALNAIGRSLLAAGDATGSDLTHRRLQSHARTLDADGAHPLTLSTLRQVAHLAGDSSGVRTIEWIETWAAAVLADEIPLHPGIRLAVGHFARSLQRTRWHIDRPDLQAALNQIVQRANFVSAYDDLLETALVRPGVTYFCGAGPDGGTIFAIARPTQSGGAVGARIDLQALVESILASDAGQSLREAGFEVALFHVQDTHEFEGRYGEAVRLVAAASDTIYRLNLGIYSRDQPFVFEHYRNRSALLVGGIAFLAAAIGLGLWVLLRETTREVETARMRAEFVANVSHELRTPLTSIRMYAETLLFDRVSSEVQRQDYLRTMMRESQRLSRMVGNILDFSRMESGRKSLEFDEVDVGQVVEDTVEEFEPLFDEQGFEVGVDIHPGLPAIPADPEALASAVANLLSNAVKYSTDDRRIQLNVYQQEQFVCVDVADHGIGVPEAERRAVFEKYRRASNAGRSATGTGLGLALVAGIAQSHGGSVDVHPRKEGGSVFRLRLPLTRSS